eukprot:TRINITY_DN1251_c6_g2_i1.p1 TRINITY_DN1251_c6_g2~~TRINITY_DN1251_c6_g2_i1.p1  ORF type:complete len:132 (+),score=8.44 TRINITY_DN1251_c6_g2_i1:202-597(+)
MLQNEERKKELASTQTQKFVIRDTSDDFLFVSRNRKRALTVRTKRQFTCVAITFFFFCTYNTCLFQNRKKEKEKSPLGLESSRPSTLFCYLLLLLCLIAVKSVLLFFVNIWYLASRSVLRQSWSLTKNSGL